MQVHAPPGRLDEIAFQKLTRLSDGIAVGRRNDRGEKGCGNELHEPPLAVFYATARRGESPRCPAISGSVMMAISR